MSAFLHELVARIRATHTRLPNTPIGRSHRRDASRTANTSRKWVIAGLR